VQLLHLKDKAFKLAVLRGIDKYVGPPMCWLLLGFSKALSLIVLSKKVLPNIEIKNILIIKYYGMGSILLASPSMQAIKVKFPKSKISILTLAENRQICEITPWIDEILLLDLKNVGRFLVNYVQMILKIRRMSFDIIVDLEFLTNFSALTTLMIGFLKEKVLVGFNSPLSWRNAVYTLNISFDHSRHITKVFSKVFSSFCGDDFEISLDFDEERRKISTFSKPASLREMLSIQPQETGDPPKNICVNINAGDLCFNRRWPREYFTTLIRELLAAYNIRVFLLGGDNDQEYVKGLIREFPDDPRVIDTSGKLSIKELVGLYSECTLLISNDSGPLHLAFMVGLPTISFFGPETPALYGPLGKNHHVLYLDLYCSPCLNIFNSKLSRCQNNICLKDISPESVFKLIEKKKILVPSRPLTKEEKC
jgi:ADP-heptose:LPS heptosyltransferase